MLKRLRRWLGWDADSGLFGLGATDLQRGRSSATGNLYAKQGPKPQQPSASAAPAVKPAPRAAVKPVSEAAPQPRLSLGKPAPEDGFDPYNTGAFNRSQSWERISRRGR